MFNKFYKLDFGLQMIITCLVLFFSNQLTTYTLSMCNLPSTLMVNLGLILTFVIFFVQIIAFYLGIKSIINYVKQTKTKNNNEQSN
jgi:protein-S-isoprenylcysteine O-methyltransferase Ste14